MPPLVPPRKDTEKMSPLQRAAITAPPPVTGSAPVAVIDEDAGRIALPFWKRVQAWFARVWHRISPPRRVRRITRPIGSRPRLSTASQGPLGR
jgi:hypothetical protein